MDIMRSQCNMTWINMSRHHKTCFSHFLKVTYYKIFITWHDKNTQCDLLLLLLLFVFGLLWIFLIIFFLKIFTIIIHVLNILFIHDISMYVHITYINACIHQGLNPKLHEDALIRSSPPNTSKL